MKHHWITGIATVLVISIAFAGYLAAHHMASAGTVPEATRVSFRWVYQPNGTQNLVSSVTSGTVTLGTGQGFNFSPQTIGNMIADVYFSDPSCECGPAGPGLWSNNGSGGVHDLGTVAFGSITSAPNKTLGVGAGQYYNNQEVAAVVGHTYVLVTRDGQDYAKLVVDSIVVVSQAYPKGDVNCSHTVNSVDALAILRKSAGLSVSLPPDCAPL